MTTTQKRILAAYQATGRVAYYYPRKKRIAISGGPLMPVKAAIAKMREHLDSSIPMRNTRDLDKVMGW